MTRIFDSKRRVIFVPRKSDDSKNHSVDNLDHNKLQGENSNELNSQEESFTTRYQPKKTACLSWTEFVSINQNNSFKRKNITGREEPSVSKRQRCDWTGASPEHLSSELESIAQQVSAVRGGDSATATLHRRKILESVGGSNRGEGVGI